MKGKIVAIVLLAALMPSQSRAVVQGAPPLFPSLLADPKEPEFFATYLWQPSSRLTSRLGSVGFGQTIGILRARDWQLSIAAGVFAAWRVYGGGEYLFTHSPADLKPGVLHAGLEYHQRGSLVRLGRLAAGRLVAALDGRSVQDRGWQIGWSFVTGLELADPLVLPGSGWRWSVQLKGYSGPSPYGEFFRDRVSSLGFGLGLTL